MKSPLTAVRSPPTIAGDTVTVGAGDVSDTGGIGGRNGGGDPWTGASVDRVTGALGITVAAARGGAVEVGARGRVTIRGVGVGTGVGAGVGAKRSMIIFETISAGGAARQCGANASIALPTVRCTIAETMMNASVAMAIAARSRRENFFASMMHVGRFRRRGGSSHLEMQRPRTSRGLASA
jgi:hypothetical protein